MFKEFLVCFHTLASYFPHLPLLEFGLFFFFFGSTVWLKFLCDLTTRKLFFLSFFVCPNTFEDRLMGKPLCWPLCFTLPPFLMIFHLSQSLWLYFWHLQLLPRLEFLVHTQTQKILPVFACPNTLPFHTDSPLLVFQRYSTSNINQIVQTLPHLLS